MNNKVRLVAFFAALCVSPGAGAQDLAATKSWEVGDRVTWNYASGGKEMRFVEEVTAANGAELRSMLRLGERAFEVAGQAGNASCGNEVCLPNGERCSFSPAWVWVDFPLAKGKTWSGKTTVTGESFVSESEYETRVEGLESITTPAGRFDAYKLSGSERLTSRMKGMDGAWQGSSKYAYWVASIRDKLVCVRNEYQNSFGASMTRELVSAELK